MCVGILVVLLMSGSHPTVLVRACVLLSVILVSVLLFGVVVWSGGLSSSFALGCGGWFSLVCSFLLALLLRWGSLGSWWEVASVTVA